MGGPALRAACYNLMSFLVLLLAGSCRIDEKCRAMAGTGSIEGFVHSASGQGVAGAGVRATEAGRAGFSTIVKADQDGKFRIDGLRPALYLVERSTESATRVTDSDLTVTIPSWGSILGARSEAANSVGDAAVAVKVVAGKVGLCDLRSVDRCTVKGKITGTSEQGLRIPVVLMEAAWMDGVEPDPGTFYEPLVSIPEANGQFCFQDLAAGRYDIFVGDTQHRLNTRLGEVVEVTLHVPSGRLTGEVVNSGGQPIGQAALYPEPRHREENLIERALRKSRRLGLDRYSACDGSYVIDVSPGRYILRVTHAGAELGVSPEVTVNDGETVNGLRIQVHPKMSPKRVKEDVR